MMAYWRIALAASLSYVSVDATCYLARPSTGPETVLDVVHSFARRAAQVLEPTPQFYSNSRREFMRNGRGEIQV
jgi:hypothetical protein